MGDVVDVGRAVEGIVACHLTTVEYQTPVLTTTVAETGYRPASEQPRQRTCPVNIACINIRVQASTYYYYYYIRLTTFFPSSSSFNEKLSKRNLHNNDKKPSCW